MKDTNLAFLRHKCEIVYEIDGEILQNLKNMQNFMYNNNGIGLAANQIGIFKRLVVIDLQENGRKQPLFLINPEIIEKSVEEIDSKESCINIKNISDFVRRYKTIKIKYTDTGNKEKILEADGLLSICLQHEIDLLDGIIFLDKIENKNNMIEEAIKNINNQKLNKLVIREIIDDREFLKQKSEKIKDEEINDNLKGIMNDMLDYIYNNSGIGLAGVQVGILKKIIVIDLQKDDIKNPIFLINPEIISHSEIKIDSKEGCLSVPGEKAIVKRYEKVEVKYTNLEKKQITIKADGLLAICLQHEIDHLNGILYVDYLSKLKRDLIIKKVEKALRNNN